MYASSGCPTHEGFAPRQRAPNSLEWLEQESADVDGISEREANQEAERLAWMGRFLHAHHDRGQREEEDGDDDEDEDDGMAGEDEWEDDDELDNDDSDNDGHGPVQMVLGDPQ